MKVPGKSRALAFLAALAAACGGGGSGGSPAAPQASRCAGVVCTAPDECHEAGTCAPATGACDHPARADGTPCSTGTCRAGTCTAAAAAAACANGVRDGAETDVDCGGPACGPCIAGMACAADADCMAGACAGGSCDTAAVAALIADPGPDRTVAGGARVLLDGSRSRSPAGPITRWQWVQTSGPAVALAAADTAHPSFDAPAVDEAGAVIGLALTVQDAGPSTAGAALVVDVAPPGPVAESTSVGFLLGALGRGTLDRDTAARYLAFAVRGDPRLPIEFRGTSLGSATRAMAAVRREFPTLSPAAQAVVRPFLLPPLDPASEEALLVASAPVAPVRGLAANAGPVAPVWRSEEGAHAVVWYWSDLADGAATAAAARNAIEGAIWPALLGQWGAAHMPVLSDAGIPGFRGTHGKVNVFLSRTLDGGKGVTVAYHGLPSPAWIELDEKLPLTGAALSEVTGLFQAAAHELAHACQYSFKPSEPIESAPWMYEGPATYAEDLVYPTVDSEHPAASHYLGTVALPLDQPEGARDYGTYVLFQAMARSGEGPQFVLRAWESFQTHRSLESVDKAFGDGRGFEFRWGGFLERAWNRDPSQEFWAVDRLKIGATDYPGPTAVAMGGVETATFELDAKVRRLAAKYRQFTFADAAARALFLYDGLGFELKEVTAADGTVLLRGSALAPDAKRGATARAMVRKDGVWIAVPSLPGAGTAYCREDPAWRADALVAVFGDWVPEKDHAVAPRGLPPRLVVSNIGCYRWAGTVTGTTSAGSTGPLEQTGATVTWERVAAPVGPLQFQVKTGSFSWRIGGTVGNCTYSGSDSWSYDSGAPTGPNPGAFAFEGNAIAGTRYRSYSGGGGGDHLVTYARTCTKDDGTTETTYLQKLPAWWATDRQADPAWRPKVSSDGTVAADAADGGLMTYTWRFTSSAGP